MNCKLVYFSIFIDTAELLANLYEAAHCRTKNGSLLNKIMGEHSKFTSIAMDRGKKKLEKEVLKVVSKKEKVSSVGFVCLNILNKNNCNVWFKAFVVINIFVSAFRLKLKKLDYFLMPSILFLVQHLTGILKIIQ